MSKVRVLLLAEIKHGMNGKTYRYSPSSTTTHTMIPKELYDSLKGVNPPLFKRVDAVKVEEVGCEVVEELSQPVTKIGANSDDKIKPIADIEYEDSETESDEVSEEGVSELESIKYVGGAIAQALTENGYVTVSDVAYANESELVELVDGIHDNNVSKIVEAAKGMVN